MDHSSSIFLQLAVVLGLSAVIGYFVKLFKMPLLVAYLLAGVLLSAVQLFDIHHSQALTFLPEIGIAFVLFFIGMELNLREVKALGKPILVAGLGQIIITSIAGYAISGLLGFPQTESIFLGIGLSVSSTIVVIKLLIEKKDLTSLYGKLALGILLLEDLVSVFILMGLTVGSSFWGTGFQNAMPFVALMIKGIGLFVLALILSNYILTRVFKAVADSSELLFISGIAWCFIFVAISLLLGFSVVIGAFLAGVALANSPFHVDLQGRMKPLRDFFVALFFVYLGTQVIFQNLMEVIPLMVAFTIFALVVKPILFALLLGIFGFRKHTIFQTGLNLSQISEFSLIIMVVGFKMGLVSQSSLTAMALTGVISIILSSLMISHSKRIYRILGPMMSFFEHDKFTHVIEKKKTTEIQDHIILIGAHRMGSQIATFLKREKIPLLVMDFNPKVVQDLIERGIHVLYGDAGDPEVLEMLNLNDAKMIISTATDMEDNLILLSELKHRRADAIVVMRAASITDATILYKKGADYVILPEVVAGDVLTEQLKERWPSVEFFKNRAEVELRKLSTKHLVVD